MSSTKSRSPRRAPPVLGKPRPPPSVASAEPAPGERGKLLDRAELVVGDAVGRLMEFWGFKRNMGRVWSLLYLSPSPLTAADLKDMLQVSSGAVSMTLAELMRWGVVKKVWVQGERRDFYVAEIALWRMISRVLGERERAEIQAAVESFERALSELEARKSDGSGEERARADMQVRRVRALLDLAKLGRTLLDVLLSTAKLDAEPLARFLLGGSRETTPP
jgi:DNA-binding transcriptional regulator GbsR (MarR family)